MALERELKFLQANLPEVSRKLFVAGGESSGRYFESNLVFDFPDRSLKAAQVLLRLREKQGRAVLTVKRPPEHEVPSALKVFEEIESEVEDCGTVRKALEAVGLHVALVYEKVREKWRFMDCTVCLDTLPFGDFVEIEGTEETVAACADALGLAGNPVTTETYHTLNAGYRRENNLDPEDSFTFPEDRKAAILREIGKD